MTRWLGWRGQDRVFEMGTGGGYQTAVISRLCRRVYSIERIDSLLERARRNLRAARHANVILKCADGTLGWEEYAPFDAVLVAAGGALQQAWVDQLADGGVLVMPVGEGKAVTLLRLRQHGRALVESQFDPCSFGPLLIGVDPG